jgi:hypothetical protein
MDNITIKAEAGRTVIKRTFNKERAIRSIDIDKTILVSRPSGSLSLIWDYYNDIFSTVMGKEFRAEDFEEQITFLAPLPRHIRTHADKLRVFEYEAQGIRVFHLDSNGMAHRAIFCFYQNVPISYALYCDENCNITKVDVAIEG